MSHIPYACEASHNMMPPKDEYWLRVETAMLPRVLASTYPLPAALDDAGAPMYTFTFLFGDVFLAQLSL